MTYTKSDNRNESESDLVKVKHFFIMWDRILHKNNIQNNKSLFYLNFQTIHNIITRVF